MVLKEERRDLFGEHYVIVEGWPVPVLLDHVVGTAMTLTEQVMEEHCKEWADEEVVVIRLPVREEGGVETVIVAEMDRIPEGVYILMSEVTGAGCLAGKQLLMVGRVGGLAEAYSLSIQDFWGEVELDPESGVYDYGTTVARSRLVAILGQEDGQLLTEEMEGEFELGSWWRIDRSYFEVAFDNLAARLARMAIMEERDDRIALLDPVGLIEKLPFVSLVG